MTLAEPVLELETIKSRSRQTWIDGDFGKIAKSLESAAEEFVDRRSITPGTRVLDVACGSGNVTIPAARTGAVVTGIDIAPNLVEQARRRAAEQSLDIRFEEGDAESLPYADGAFDVILSMFGAMFAPRPKIAAAEMLRVCRPGGEIAMANWTATGFAGQMFKLVAGHVPPPPVPPPVLWGDAKAVRERLGGGASKIDTSVVMAEIRYPFPPAEVVDYFREHFGPVRNAFAALPEAERHALRRDLVELWSSHNRAMDDTTRVSAEYLEVVATRA